MKVIKRDGSIEDFNQSKIARVVKAAGFNDNQALKLAKEVANWAKAKRQNQITWLQIRDKVRNYRRLINMPPISSLATKKLKSLDK